MQLWLSKRPQVRHTVYRRLGRGLVARIGDAQHHPGHPAAQRAEHIQRVGEPFVGRRKENELIIAVGHAAIRRRHFDRIVDGHRPDRCLDAKAAKRGFHHSSLRVGDADHIDRQLLQHCRRGTQATRP